MNHPDQILKKKVKKILKKFDKDEELEGENAKVQNIEETEKKRCSLKRKINSFY